MKWISKKTLHQQLRRATQDLVQQKAETRRVAIQRDRLRVMHEPRVVVLSFNVRSAVDVLYRLGLHANHQNVHVFTQPRDMQGFRLLHGDHVIKIPPYPEAPERTKTKWLEMIEEFERIQTISDPTNYVWDLHT